MTEEGEASKIFFFGLVMLMKVFAKHKKKAETHCCITTAVQELGKRQQQALAACKLFFQTICTLL
jgi:hypothetical protein